MTRAYHYKYQSGGTAGNKGNTKSITLPRQATLLGVIVSSFTDTGTQLIRNDPARLQIKPTEPELSPLPNESQTFDPAIEIDVNNPPSLFVPITLQKFDLITDFEASTGTYWMNIVLFFEYEN